MSPAPEVSILINNRNYGRYAGEAIDSALAQEDVAAEVIVVDGGSTDNSAEVVRGFGDRVRGIFQPNSGQDGAVNAGVAEARAPSQLRSGGRWPFPMTSSLSVRRKLRDRAGALPDGFTKLADALIAGVMPFLASVEAIPEALGYHRVHDKAWYRKHDDAPMLARRMAHREEMVRVTNRFLRARGIPSRVWLRDHFAHRVAAARLGLPGARRPLSPVRAGLTDAGEPNPVRRLRAAMGELTELRRDLPDGESESPP